MALSTAGTYLISCNVNINATYTASAIGSLLLSVVHNGNAVGQVEALSYSGTAYTYQNQVAAIVNCSVGDTLGGTVYLTNPIGYYSSAYTSGSSNGLQIVKLV